MEPQDDPDAYGEDEDEENEEDPGRPYRPPGNDHDGERGTFAQYVARNFLVPARLRDKPYELIEAANDWHYAMMNDHPRNDFYREALRRVVTPESFVLEIGAGSGLLSIIAATLGAKCVVAIEANRHLAAVAREIIRRNGFEDRVHIINKMSTDVAPDEIARYGTPNVLLSEILGTLLLGESALHYVMDARQRLTPGAAVVPRKGSQFATLIESNDVAAITSVKGWEGIDLGWFNTLQDTTSMVFTKQYGFRFSSCKYRELAAKTPVLELDFATDAVGVWKSERRQRLVATASGTVHAILASWEVYDGNVDGASGGASGGSAAGADGQPLVMSTHPSATLDNFPRDMQWGQGLQLIEDPEGASEGAAPKPFVVTAGEALVLVTRFSADGVTVQFQLEREGASPTSVEPMPEVD